MKLRSTFFLCALSLLAYNHAKAQTIDIGPNQYAFRLTVNPNYGLFFNAGNQRYEFMNSAGNPIFGFDANNGQMSTNLQFQNGSDFLVGPNRYAFRSAVAPSVGLFATNNRIQFLNQGGNPTFSIGINDGKFDTDIAFFSGKSLVIDPGTYLARSSASANVGLVFGATNFEFRNASGNSIFRVNANNGNTEVNGTLSATGGNSSQWNQAHSWGNHAAAGYLNNETDPKIAAGMTSGDVPRWNGSQLVSSPLKTGTDFAEIEGDNATLRLSSDGFLGGSAKVEFNNGAIQSGEIYSALGAMFYNNNNENFPIHVFQQNGTTRMTITEDGKVAINNDGSPSSELKIARSDLGGRGLDVDVTYSGNSDVIAVYGRSVTNDGFGVGADFNGGYKGVIARNTAGAYSGTTRALEAISTGSGGQGTRVGVYGSATGGATNWAGFFQNGDVYVAEDLRIGTTAGANGYRLSVNGKSMATEMRVQAVSNWPDYVFEEAHQRMNVDELEDFVTTHKHLPGVPSAAEVEAEGGFDLGEMQKIALEKIEEMSLYIIEQNKMIKELQKEVELLKKEKQ